MKVDSVFDLPCECGLCEPDMTFECPGCLRDFVPYCQGGSEPDYWEYCTPCWYILTTEGMNGPVIQKESPNLFFIQTNNE